MKIYFLVNQLNGSIQLFTEDKNYLAEIYFIGPSKQYDKWSGPEANAKAKMIFEDAANLASRIIHFDLTNNVMSERKRFILAETRDKIINSIDK